MKTTLFLCLGLLAAVPGRAQLFRPEAVNGALIGGLAGAVIGNNSGDLHHNGAKGAAIGAAAGLLLGQAVGNASAYSAPVSQSGVYVYRQPPTVSVGIELGSRRGYSHGYYGGGRGNYEGYRGSSFGYYPGYDAGVYPYGYGSYGYGSGASNGLWLGALAGGIIGNNSGSLHHDAWRGAAWGAGLGWLLGSVADANQRAAYQPPVSVQAAPTAAATPPSQPVTIINNYYNTPATPMTEVNGLFGRK